MSLRRTTPVPDCTHDIYGRKLIWEGNANFYNPNQKLEYTREQFEEIVKCKNDINYFAENYCYITSLDKGEHIIELYDYQKEFYQHLDLNRFSIALFPRQYAKSTSLVVYILHKVLFNKGFKVLMGSHDIPNAQEIFYDRLIPMYEMIPKFLKPTYTESNKSKLSLTNGSSILSGQVSKKFGRGNTYNIIYCDELAFYDTKLWDDFYESVYPTITSAVHVKTQFIITSTPKGINQFYEKWNGAIKGTNDFKPFRVQLEDKPWASKEEFKAWCDSIIKNVGLRKWRQEFLCEFLSSEGGLFSPESLAKINTIDPIETIYDQETLKIYRHPEEGHNYLIIGDIAEGTGGNYTVMNIIDVSTKPFEQVAVFRDNQSSMNITIPLIMSLSKRYNEALAVIENNFGDYVVKRLWYDEEFEELYYDYEHDKPGLRTTKATKKFGVSKLKEFVENGMIIINDFETLKECSNFGLTKSGSYQGIGSDDDVVMTLVIFAYFTTTDYFEENYKTVWLSNFFGKERENMEKKLADFEDDEAEETFGIYKVDGGSVEHSMDEDGYQKIDDGFELIDDRFNREEVSGVNKFF